MGVDVCSSYRALLPITPENRSGGLLKVGVCCRDAGDGKGGGGGGGRRKNNGSSVNVQCFHSKPPYIHKITFTEIIISITNFALFMI